MRVLYIGPDDRAVHLEHGKHYFITRKKLKNGKIRVTVEDIGLKKTYANEILFERDFRKQ